MKILITGANGFLGSHLVHQYAQHGGYEVIAAVRKGADISNLHQLQCSIEPIPYTSEEGLIAYFESKRIDGGLDLIIHNAAVTIAANKQTFFEVNTALSKRLFQAIQQSGVLNPQGKVVYISSLAALGPQGVNQPVSAYGWSKLEAENILKSMALPYVIYRPTGVYGPKNKEFLPLFKQAAWGLYPVIGDTKQRFTLIHVEDLAKNIVNITADAINKTIHLDDGNVYTAYHFRDSLAQGLNKKIRFLFIPRSIIFPLIGIAQTLLKPFNKKPAVTTEKLNEVTQNWDHNFEEERNVFPLAIKYNLTQGIANTIDSYKTQGLL